MRGNRVEITRRHSGEITVSLPYAQHPADNPTYIKRLKGVDGHRWDPEQKCPKDPCGLDIPLIS